MRFTLTNVFIISTVALLSLVPAANAANVGFINPKPKDTIKAGKKHLINWYVPKRGETEREAMIGL
jgi:hypothetical protein